MSRVIDGQRMPLHELSTGFFDQLSQLAEDKAESVELKLEVSRILKTDERISRI
ncbi:hypothetical protein ACX80E_15060 [Arthrobacter sp. TMN-49]